jgi:hypothetical protein
LEAIKATTVLVPMASWNHKGGILGGEESTRCIDIITTYSLYKTELEILKQFQSIETTGTHIVIFNLRKVQGTLALLIM